MLRALFLIILAENIATFRSEYNTTSFRKLAVQVSGYTHFPFIFENGECCVPSDCSSRTCSRTVVVLLNDIEVCFRSMTDRFTDLNGEFICYVEITEKNTNLQSVFTEKIKLTVLVKSNQEKIFFKKTVFDGQITPGLTAQKMEHLGNGADVSYLLQYTCFGYVGYNCKFKCDLQSDDKYCDWYTGEPRCVNGNRNIETCSDPEEHICKTNNPCMNGSECKKVSLSQYTCECKPGFIGQNCSKFTCDKPCDPLRGKCVGPNECECYDGYKGTDCTASTCSSGHYCRNDGMCFEANGLRYCSCDTTQYTGLRCEHTCSPQCMYGQCFHSENKTVCICDEGFRGPACEELIQYDYSLINSNVLSKRTKRLISVGVAFGIILVAIVAISLSMVRRRRIMKAYELMTRTEAVCKTITRNTMTLQR